MTDEHLPPERTLASAALDNEVGTDERALLDQSPELQAELAFYQDLQLRVRQVDVPTDAREQAIAAALDAFSTSASTATAANVVALNDRRRRQYRWAGTAAAAAIVGIAIAGTLNRDDGSDSTTAAKSSTVTIAGADTNPSPAAADAGGSGDESLDLSTDQTVDAYVAEAAPEVAGAVPAPAEPADRDGVTSITTREELIAFVLNDFELSTALPDSMTPPEAPATTAAAEATVAEAAAESSAEQTTVACSFDVDLPSAFVLYNGVPVIVRRDDASRTIVLVDQLTCATLDTIALP